MIGQQQGPYATISVNVLPTPESQRLGGRQASNLY
jgi:8-hydroxy-5-deazaflavin:NADPH oxidoreductase